MPILDFIMASIFLVIILIFEDIYFTKKQDKKLDAACRTRLFKQRKK